MSHPFGGHPTLGRFVEFAKTQGCNSVVEIRQTIAGRTYEALVLTNADGINLTIADPDPAEHLAPTMVSQYQRRL